MVDATERLLNSSIMVNVSVDALRRARLNELPSPPELLTPLLRLCGDEEAVPADARRIISRDAAISTRVLAAASAPVFARSHPITTLEGAVYTLGMDTVRSLALAATVQQFFSSIAGQNRNWLPMLWEQSLDCATLARQIARHTGSARPEEAYLAGLLHNIGQLALSYQLKEDYSAILDEARADDRYLPSLERERLGVDHLALGGDLLQRWGLPPLLVDAVRYHQEEADTLADAHGLVRTVAVARALIGTSTEPDAVARYVAGRLFDLGPTALYCISHQGRSDRERIQSALAEHGEPAPLPTQATGRDSAVGQGLRQATLIGDVRRHLFSDQPVDGIARCVMLLFGIPHVLCLQRETDGGFLRVDPPTGHDPRLAEFRVPLARERSLLARCLLDDHPLHTLDPEVESGLSVIDRQLCAQLPGDGLLCMPMRADRTPVGVLVLGIRHDQVSALLDESPLLLAFAREAGRALLAAERWRRRQDDQLRESLAATALEHDELRQEAGTPLAIMQNYLAALEQQLEADHPARTSLLAVGEEAQRLARLLAEDNPDSGEPAWASVNEQVRRVAQLAARSGALPAGLTPALALDPVLDQSAASAPPALQQVLLNLLRAVGGHINGASLVTLRTSGFVETAGQRYIEIVVEDNGSGFPDSVREQLVGERAARTDGAEGERLNVANALLRDMGGWLTHRQVPGEGTRIQVLVPASFPDDSGVTHTE
ncbi:HDOD domain-containing protein [Aquisalimonas lutea]|uniref:HDOD domain-containing protein n=1 Tax=Aquisalimonas lutea TaxID=1327750 RepID=UPI0025B440DD|nr:HDOD domain-containing protein [Aquisalimonas lutea]MDN3516176.1 HDOD domain-containing protein [Aquisalimonas lutea]